jgi:hypothetical protein
VAATPPQAECDPFAIIAAQGGIVAPGTLLYLLLLLLLQATDSNGK